MLGLRADMTMQIVRIATTRLAAAPRPLRLSYAGQVLRVRGSQLRPERQFTQVGVELIGSDAVAADVEIIVLAAQSLADAGIEGISVDLNSPLIVAALLDSLGLPAAQAARLRASLDRKDAAALAQAVEAGETRRLLAQLIDAAGPALPTLERLRAIALPPAAQREVAHLADVVAGIAAVAPDLPLTVDAVEYRGFEYQTGVSFTLFARKVRGELGRGGRYAVKGIEPATGFSLFLDSVMRAVPPPEPQPRLYLPHGTPGDLAARLRGEGWICVAGLAPEAAGEAEARRLGCSHILAAGGAQPLAKA
jgi:ATP phosphoribosyltransferase regulatory subunit